MSSSASSPSEDQPNLNAAIASASASASASPPQSDSLDGNSLRQALAVFQSTSSGSREQLMNKMSSILKKKSVEAGIGAGIGVLLLLLIICIICVCRRKKRRPVDNKLHNQDNCSKRGSTINYNGASPGRAMSFTGSEMSSSPGRMMGYNQYSFTYNDLAAATNCFSDDNLLGQGGFGYVYKGVLPNGKEVAVKSLKANSGQGEREFQAEVDIISRVHHRHLVSLIGYCMADSQRMLVYEFVPNGTLEYHLHAADRPTMDWPTRLKIAVGAAKGFAYLHEDCHPRIIHRDIKAANILIDARFEAKVADFGLAKLSNDANTHVSTRIMGTFGYLAPEYASTGKLTDKSDVYSFGIMLLELITGRRPIDMSKDDDDTLIEWARPILAKVFQGGSFEELVDPRLGNNYDPHEMLRMVHCAAAATRHSGRQRPKMSKLVRILDGGASLDDLNEGIKMRQGSMQSSDFDSRRAIRPSDVLLSQELTSGELSPPMAR